MFNRLSRSDQSTHIHYVSAEDMTNQELDNEISAMENSRLAPRKNYLRQERIQRRVAELGLAQTEVLLGITEENNG